MSTDPTAEHIRTDPACVEHHIRPPAHGRGIACPVCIPAPLTDPAALAASLPAEVMLAALVDRGTLERRPVCHEPGWTHLVEVDWREVAP